MINRGKMPRQLRNKGGITNVTPRTNYFLGGIKNRIRKLIPNELADVAVKAAPFVAPFNPGVAGLMRGIGRFDQRGSISDAFKQGIATAGFGAGARALGGAPDIFGGGIRGGFTSPLSEGRTTAVKNLFNPKKTSTFDAVAEDELAGDKILTEATKGTGTGVKTPGIGPIEKLRQQIPIINKLDPIVGQQLIVGGATSAASLIYDSFVDDYRDHDPETESYDEYLARRKEVVGKQMRQYFDNYFKFDKEYSALDDAGKDAFVARYNLAKGGRVEYQTGGITMANTLQQNLAANQAQATNIQSILNQARKQAGLPSVQPTVAPTQTTSAPASSITKSSPTPTQTSAPSMQQVTSQMMAPTQNIPPNVIMPSAPGASAGLTEAQFNKLPQAQQDKIMDAEAKSMDQQVFRQSPFYEQTRMETPTQLKILQERGFDTSTLYNQQGDIDTDKLVLAKLRTDLQEQGVQLTGNETPFDLLQLEEEEKRKIMKEMSETPFFQDVYNYTGPTNFQISGGVASPMAKGGRIELMGGAMPTGIMKTNKAGVMERDYRDKGGFVPVGIKEKADDVPAMLSKNEFVMTANAVRGAGNGSIEKGAQKMYDTMKRLEKRVV